MARRRAKPKPKPKAPEVKPGMTLDEIRKAGLVIDLPTEAASPNPQPLRYSDGTSTMDADRPWNQPRKPRKGRDGTSD